MRAQTMCSPSSTRKSNAKLNAVFPRNNPLQSQTRISPHPQLATLMLNRVCVITAPKVFLQSCLSWNARSSVT